MHEVCHEYSIPLFIDGARLGYGLMSEANDIDPKELPGLCDVFYVGGTKVGALFGEAVVFTHGNAPAHFFTTIKQHGALMAKGSYETFIDSPTNQQFFVMSRKRAEELHTKVRFENWCPVDEDRIAVRFVTSWATPEENVLALKEKI